MSKKRVLSGIQPSGLIHLGNYFGAIKQYIEMQNEGNECFFFIANYHALTTIKDPIKLKQNTIDVALKYLSFGLDPDKVSLFKQSDVPEVNELAWYLSTITPMGLLERCHSYKDKIAKGFLPEHGLFAYPVLMAADILIYQSDVVPVGKDQKQHVEVTRDIGIKFNNTFDNVLTIPEVRIQDSTAVVPGIDGQKMSKSYNNTINPFLPEKQLKKQIMSIVTDSRALEDPKEPESCNVFKLYKLFADENQISSMADKYKAGGYGYGHAKKELLGIILDYFKESRQRYEDYKNNIDYINKVLKDGSDKARQSAVKTIKTVRDAVGII